MQPLFFRKKEVSIMVCWEIFIKCYLDNPYPHGYNADKSTYTPIGMERMDYESFFS